ncbi:uncharacterized protein VTP21DRAFT_6604 [Calcarisporiella thermophila]|uniref:uncharacterized protein n=1 Tax=Calcarisporiella thermophila TaxID=911321 RepID=UPI0037449EA6
MSLSQLVQGGPECGPSNAVTGLTKQFMRDRSHQQERFVPERQDGSRATGIRSMKMGPNLPSEQEFSDAFFQEESMRLPRDHFTFSEMSKELDALHPVAANAPPGSDWAADFMQHSEGMHPLPPQDFQEFEAVFNRSHAMNDWHKEFEQFHHQTALGPVDPTVQEAFEKAFDAAKQGVDWEREFAAQESWATEFQQEHATEDSPESLAKTAGLLVESVDSSNPKFQTSNFMNFMRKLRDQEVTIQGNKVVENAKASTSWADEFGQQQSRSQQANASDPSWISEFEQHIGKAGDGRMWSDEFAKQLDRNWTEEFERPDEVSSVAATAHTGATDWATEFSGGTAQENWAEEFQQEGSDELEQVLQQSKYDFEQWVEEYKRNIGHLAQEPQDIEWESLQKDWEKFRDTSGLGYRADNPRYDNYEFEPNNPYLATSVAVGTPGADLMDSILRLEAAVQQDPSNSDAWCQLGIRQQENERDEAAIAALRRALQLNPRDLEAWMAIAASYTNENCRLDAYDALENWIANHEKYSPILERQGKMRINGDRHTFVSSLFLEAARSRPGPEMDADVQIGLGVMFNVSGEYMKAVDCFQAALATRPDDYFLWNKLGATLANAREPQRAIEAYFNALDIQPSYIRARYNLAISSMNLGQYREATEHLLGCLALQAGQVGTSDEQLPALPKSMVNSSEGVWDTLRSVLMMQSREDLAVHCDRKNLGAFRSEFDF